MNWNGVILFHTLFRAKSFSPNTVNFHIFYNTKIHREYKTKMKKCLALGHFKLVGMIVFCEMF